jgi:hypothetical protein
MSLKDNTAVCQRRSLGRPQADIGVRHYILKRRRAMRMSQTNVGISESIEK